MDPELTITQIPRCLQKSLIARIEINSIATNRKIAKNVKLTCQFPRFTTLFFSHLDWSPVYDLIGQVRTRTGHERDTRRASGDNDYFKVVVCLTLHID